MKHLRVLIPLLVFAGLVGFLWVGLGKDPREVPSPFIGKMAPPTALQDLRDPNTTINTNSLKGRYWLLNVWASWCTVCIEEHSTLMAYARMDKLPIVGLNYKDGRTQGLQWLGRYGNPYTVTLFDPDGRTGIEWGVYGVPETFLIDPDGRVLYKHAGALTPAIWSQKIEPLIRAKRG